MAYDFNGTSDDIVFGADTYSIGGTSNFSASVWFKLDTDTGWRSIFSKTDNSGGDPPGEIFFKFSRNDGDDVFFAEAGYSGGKAELTLSATTDLSVHHAAMTWDTSTYRGYLDGTEQDTVVNGSAKVNPNDVPVMIGIDWTAAHAEGEHWPGLVGECAIWTRTLSASEVAGLAKGFSALFYSQNLVFYAPLIRHSGTAFSIIGGYSATINGAVVVPHFPIIYPASPQIITAPAVAGISPTSTLYGPFVGPLGGPI
jgi:hypothetical protein